ncbi:hypothetical protein GCM10010969_11450 [Saccharibacillus kuerlensis]|uniref:Uncharacterized protein n=1 Tax=Saccharibacillus kuerlensis TaxID=459527 RepID=A0ABQ2KWM0_9BACL|nr:hypothetical protein GCM10010969_11450 [Saccharibacillus kuerlensis]
MRNAVGKCKQSAEKTMEARSVFVLYSFKAINTPGAAYIERGSGITICFQQNYNTLENIFYAGE